MCSREGDTPDPSGRRKEARQYPFKDKEYMVSSLLVADTAFGLGVKCPLLSDVLLGRGAGDAPGDARQSGDALAGGRGLSCDHQEEPSGEDRPLPDDRRGAHGHEDGAGPSQAAARAAQAKDQEEAAPDIEDGQQLQLQQAPPQQQLQQPHQQQMGQLEDEAVEGEEDGGEGDSADGGEGDSGDGGEGDSAADGGEGDSEDGEEVEDEALVAGVEEDDDPGDVVVRVEKRKRAPWAAALPPQGDQPVAHEVEQLPRQVLRKFQRRRGG